MAIQARATDTGGNVTISAPITIDLVPDTFAPTVVATSVANGDKRGQAFRAFTMDFSEPMDTATLTAANIQLVGPGGPVGPQISSSATATAPFSSRIPPCKAG